MALNEDDIQLFLSADDDVLGKPRRSQFRSDSGAVGRAWIDGTLVVYDLEDIPAWLGEVLKARDEDGDTSVSEPRTNDSEISDALIAAGR